MNKSPPRRGIFSIEMKRIIYTKHAEEMLTARGIDRKMVESCLVRPSKIIPAREHTLAYLKVFNANSIKVIVADEKESLVVITVYWIAKDRVNQ
jgi:hypothetical protein